MKRNSIQHIAETIANRKIKWAFGVTGSGKILELISALHDRGIQYFPLHDERMAALIAGGVASNYKLESVCMTIKGPGYANMVGASLCNFYESRPVLSISEAYESHSEREHKRLNHAHLSQMITKAYAIYGQGHQLEKLMDISEEETPGPIHLDLCASSRYVSDEMIKFKSPSKEAKSHSFHDSIKRISKAKKPLLLLGSLVKRKFPTGFFDAVRVPVFETAVAKGVFNENSDYWAGITTGEWVQGNLESVLMEESDLILALGLRPYEVVNPIQYGPQIINIDICHEAMATFPRAMPVEFPHDLSLKRELWDLLKEREWGRRLIREQKTKLENQLLHELAFNPAHLFDALNNQQFLDFDLVVDTGLFCTTAECLWKANANRKFLGTGVGRFMGTAIPTAIGHSLKNRNRPILCLFGDGGVAPNFHALSLAKQENLPITFVLMSDGQYGSIAMASDRPRVWPGAFTQFHCDWTKRAAAFGLIVNEVQTIREFMEVWKSTLGKGPHFIKVSFNPMAYMNAAKLLRG